MTYVDLRPDNVREVQVLIDGQWITGELEAYRRNGEAWQGWVRYSVAIGQNHIDWFTEEQLRRDP